MAYQANTKYILLGVTIFAFLFLFFLLNATFLDKRIKTSHILVKNKKVIAAGEIIYGLNCASCHGDKLEGQPDWKTPDSNGLMPAPPHDQTGHTWHHTDEVLFGITKYGLAKFSGLKNYKTNMPAYENILSDDEIVAVLSFIKSTWPERVKNRHNEMNSQDVNMK